MQQGYAWTGVSIKLWFGPGPNPMGLAYELHRTLGVLSYHTGLYKTNTITVIDHREKIERDSFSSKAVKKRKILQEWVRETSRSQVRIPPRTNT